MLCRCLSPDRRLYAFAHLAALLTVLPVLSSAVGAQPTASPVAARIWFYQQYEPYVSTNYATVRINGAVVGSVSPYGGFVYSDVPPGRYRLSADSFGTDVNQAVDVDLAAAQEVFAKIENLPSWTMTGTLSAFQRDTFYLRLVPPATARAEMTQRPF